MNSGQGKKNHQIDVQTNRKVYWLRSKPTRKDNRKLKDKVIKDELGIKKERRRWKL